jgi:hypothetical protein
LLVSCHSLAASVCDSFARHFSGQSQEQLWKGSYTDLYKNPGQIAEISVSSWQTVVNGLVTI